MLNQAIIASNIPVLNLHDSVRQALAVLEDFSSVCLPVVDDSHFIGLAFHDDLQHQDPDKELSAFVPRFPKVSVQANTHFLEAIRTANAYRLSLVPVVEPSGVYVGALTLSDLLQSLGKITGAGEPGAVIVLAIPKRDFSLQELSRLIENSETRIRQFNTYWDEAEQLLQVTLKLNQFEISDVLNTLQHHDYPIKYYFGEELFVNELRSNFEHLMNYLNI